MMTGLGAFFRGMRLGRGGPAPRRMSDYEADRSPDQAMNVLPLGEEHETAQGLALVAVALDPTNSRRGPDNAMLAFSARVVNRTDRPQLFENAFGLVDEHGEIWVRSAYGTLAHGSRLPATAEIPPHGVLEGLVCVRLPSVDSQPAGT